MVIFGLPFTMLRYWLEMENKYHFLYSGIYPYSFTKNQKRVLRMITKNFLVCEPLSNEIPLEGDDESV